MRTGYVSQESEVEDKTDVSSIDWMFTGSTAALLIWDQNYNTTGFIVVEDAQSVAFQTSRQLCLWPSMDTKRWWYCRGFDDWHSVLLDSTHVLPLLPTILTNGVWMAPNWLSTHASAITSDNRLEVAENSYICSSFAASNRMSQNVTPQ